MKRTLIVVALAAAFPLTVLAQSTNAPGKEKGPSFNQFDKDRDGYVSREEAKSSRDLSSRFSQLDKNNDGKLSAQELGDGSMGSHSGSNTTTPRSNTEHATDSSRPGVDPKSPARSTSEPRPAGEPKSKY